MPFLLIIAGLLMVVTAANNTHAQMAAQLGKDGTEFSKWLVAFGIVGGLGYVDDLRNLSRAFMALILISLVLSNSKTGRGVIGNFQDAINAGPTPIAPAPSTGSNGQGSANQIFGMPTVSIVPGSFADTVRKMFGGSQ